MDLPLVAFLDSSHSLSDQLRAFLQRTWGDTGVMPNCMRLSAPTLIALTSEVFADPEGVHMLGEMTPGTFGALIGHVVAPDGTLVAVEVDSDLPDATAVFRFAGAEKAHAPR